METQSQQPDASRPKFERTGSASLASEFWGFLRDNKAWWIAPIILCALLLAGVVVLGSTGAAPFIYTLF